MSYKRVFGAKTRKVVPPGKDTTNSSRKRNAWDVAYFRVAGRKVATKKLPFGGFSRGDLLPRHAKIRHIYKWRVFALHLLCLRMAGRKVATRKHATSFVSCFFAFIFAFLLNIIICALDA